MSSTVLTSRPAPLWNTLPSQREARERLIYVSERRGTGLLTGCSGTGKSRLFADLKVDLDQQGMQVTLADATGWSGSEFAQQIASKLQLGLSLKASSLEAWTRLEQWATGLRQIQHQRILLLDHVDRMAGAEGGLDRLLSLFSGAVPCLVACSIPVPEQLKPIFLRHCPLRIELQRLNEDEVRSYTETQVPRLHTSPNGMKTLRDLSRGKLRSLERLTDLASSAAQAEESLLLDSSLIKASSREVRL